jgi:1-acyl-sn-glycerol-3-phosphate acyltransferase
MVAREYCEHPMFRWFLKTCNVIPVNRGGIDTAATKAAIRCVREGGLVGMFPEGRINTSGEFMLPVRPVAAVVAIKAGVPMIPCYIEGSPYDRTPWSPFLMFARVRVRFGDELQPTVEEKETRDPAANSIAEVVRRISELAGQSDFKPTLAGRRWKPTEAELAEGKIEAIGKQTDVT